ncbi:MAG: thiamine phosphate synthase [Nitrospinae bacterium]|nr:thiamine phosphate synthase [Nitrospinota bacterium]
MEFDPSLIVITDRKILAQASGWKLGDAVRAAASSGASMLQLREKNMSGMEMIRLADELREALEGTGCAFTVNDRVDVALTCGAEGVHLGQEDFPLTRARAIAGDALFYGVTAGKSEWASRAADEGADYIGVGPIYATGSKADARVPIGPEGFRRIIQHAPGLPAVAIGGIDVENVEPVMEAGASGIAVIGAVMGASDPEAATRELRNRIEKAKG